MAPWPSRRVCCRSLLLRLRQTVLARLVRQICCPCVDVSPLLLVLMVVLR